MATESQARRAAKRVGLTASKARGQQHSNSRGGLQLVDERNVARIRVLPEEPFFQQVTRLRNLSAIGYAGFKASPATLKRFIPQRECKSKSHEDEGRYDVSVLIY
jgi:hypothetical protein